MRTVIGRKWLPARGNGLWLTVAVWWVENHTRGMMIRLASASYLPPARARRAWRVLRIYHLNGQGGFADGGPWAGPAQTAL